MPTIPSSSPNSSNAPGFLTRVLNHPIFRFLESVFRVVVRVLELLANPPLIIVGFEDDLEGVVNVELDSDDDSGQEIVLLRIPNPMKRCKDRARAGGKHCERCRHNKILSQPDDYAFQSMDFQELLVDCIKGRKSTECIAPKGNEFIMYLLEIDRFA